MGKPTGFMEYDRELPQDRTRDGERRGPAVIAEADCTIWVAEGWTARVGGGGAWVLTR